MAIFEPRRIFRCATPEALRGYFHHHQVNLGIDWDQLPDGDWRSIWSAWQQTPDDIHSQVASDFHEINTMSSDVGIQALHEQARLQDIDLTPMLIEGATPIDFVLRVYVEYHDDIWIHAARFAVADRLDGGRSWHRYDGLPSFAVANDEPALERLREGLSVFYRTIQGRGQHCLVEHSQRENGQHYYFCYLSDYPMSREQFDEGGHLLRGIERGAFLIIFACNEVGGVVHVCSDGGRKVRDPLLKIFGRAIAGTELEADPNRSAGRYHLGQFRRRRELVVDPAIVESAVIRQVSFRVIGAGPRSVTMKADPESGPLDIYQMLSDWLDNEQVPMSNIELQTINFSIVLPHDGKRTPRFSFYITRTGCCDLRSKSEQYRTIGEQLLEDWGAIDARMSTGVASGSRAAS